MHILTGTAYSLYRVKDDMTFTGNSVLFHRVTVNDMLNNEEVTQ